MRPPLIESWHISDIYTEDTACPAAPNPVRHTAKSIRFIDFVNAIIDQAI